MKRFWLNSILHISSLIYKKKESFTRAGFAKKIVLAVQIVFLEIFISLISLPFYFFITPAEVFVSNKKEIKIYRMRRRITFATLAIFIFWNLTQLTVFFGGIVVSPSNIHAAGMVDGSNAIDVLGQYDEASLSNPQPSYTKGNAHDAPNRLGFNSPQGAAFDSVNHRLFIADTSNNRVFVYNLNTDNTLPDRVPDNVLGQANFSSNSTGTATQSKMSSPYGLAYDSTNNYLFVADTSYNRVTIYDVASITNGENAMNVLGQPNFTTSSSGTTQAKMSAPRGVFYDGTNSRLFVADSSNHRVITYDVASITDGENAVNVLGQPDFTTGSSAATQAKMTNPYGVAFDSTNNRLFVAETGVNRVTVYDLASITNGENAVNVLGQANFTSSSPSFTATGINGPQGVFYDSTNSRLFVSQNTSNRVTVYDVASITDGESAVNVLGQSIFTANSTATTQSGMYNPFGMAYDSTNHRLYVAQGGNSRVSVFDIASITDGENAVDLLGQYDGASLSDPQPVYTKGSTLANDTPNRLGYNAPQNMMMDSVHHRLFVADNGNNRILVYNLDSSNALLDRIPDNVLGQSNFSSNASAATQSGMSSPRGLAYDSVNNRLFVAEQFFHRVKVYDVASITDGENAVNVLGQTNFTGSSSGNTQAKLNAPQGLVYDSANSRLFVSQSGNNRVTVYDVASITDGENAVNVLGQANFTATSTANTQAGMNSPQGVAYDSTNSRLFVSQSGNNRVTVYDVASITDGENAVNVLGQSTYTGFGSATTQSGMNSPMGAFHDSANSRLFVADYSNNRISVFDTSLAGFSVTESSGSTAVTEGGATDSFTVVLTAQPTTDVIFNVSSSDITSATVSAATLTFTSANWDTPQTITVTAPVDADTVSETPTITVSVNDALSDDAFDPLPDQVINVSVDDTTALSVNDVTSSTTNGTYTTGGIISIQIVFNKVVTVTGTPQLTLETGASDAVVNYSSGSGTDTLTFLYTVGPGQNSADLDYASTSALALNGGTIKDAGNNSAVLSLATPGQVGSLGANKAIEVDTILPAVTNVTSSTTNGLYTTGGVISIQVVFNKVVTVTGTPQLTLETGATDKVVDYDSGSGTNTLTFVYTVGSGDTSLDLDYVSNSALALNGGTIKDVFDVDVTLTLPTPGSSGSLGANKNIVLNTVAPILTDVTSSTADGSYTAGSIVSIQVVFSEAVTVTGTPQLILETGAIDAVVDYSSGSGTDTLTFLYTVGSDQNSADLDYVSTSALALNGGSIKDAATNDANLTLVSPAALNSLGGNKNIVIDTTAPTISNVTSSTVNGAYVTGGIVSIQVVFSEAVTVTGTPQLTLETGASDAVVDYSSGSGTDTLTFLYTAGSGQNSVDLDYVSTSALALNGGTIKDGVGLDATLNLAIPAALHSLGSNKNIEIDTMNPGTVSLQVVEVDSTSVRLTWNAPGDDNDTGTATLYDIRYSSSPITTDNFAAATQASGFPVPQAASTAQSLTVPGLSTNSNYYFAMKVYDNAENVSFSAADIFQFQPVVVDDAPTSAPLPGSDSSSSSTSTSPSPLDFHSTDSSPALSPTPVTTPVPLPTLDSLPIPDTNGLTRPLTLNENNPFPPAECLQKVNISNGLVEDAVTVKSTKSGASFFLQKNTKVTLDKETPYTGLICEPVEVKSADLPKYLGKDLIYKNAVKIEASKPVFFDKLVKIIIPLPADTELNLVKVYTFNPEKQVYELLDNGGTAIEINRTIVAKTDHFSLFVVAQTIPQLSIEIPDDSLFPTQNILGNEARLTILPAILPPRPPIVEYQPLVIDTPHDQPAPQPESSAVPSTAPLGGSDMYSRIEDPLGGHDEIFQISNQNSFSGISDGKVTIQSLPEFADLDQDGLSGNLEKRFGTDPNNQDTDHDGMSDGQEVLVDKTDPKNVKDLIDPKKIKIRITGFEEGQSVDDGRLFVKGVAPAGSTVEIFAINSKKKQKNICETVTSDNGVFVCFVSEVLADGGYSIGARIVKLASLQSMIAFLSHDTFISTLADQKALENVSPFVHIKVNTKLNISAPKPEKLADKVLTDDNLFKDLRVEIKDNKPVLYGKTGINHEIVATWKSVVLTSALIVDSTFGEFSLSPTQVLEPGFHDVYIQSIRPQDHALSKTIKISFKIDENAITSSTNNTLVDERPAISTSNAPDQTQLPSQKSQPNPVPLTSSSIPWIAIGVVLGFVIVTILGIRVFRKPPKL